MRYRLIDESQITEYDKKLSNDEIAKCLNDLWGNWWKEVRDKDPITDEELEKVLESARRILEKHNNGFIVGLFLPFEEQLEFRRENKRK